MCVPSVHVTYLASWQDPVSLSSPPLPPSSPLFIHVRTCFAFFIQLFILFCRIGHTEVGASRKRHQGKGASRSSNNQKHAKKRAYRSSADMKEGKRERAGDAAPFCITFFPFFLFNPLFAFFVFIRSTFIAVDAVDVFCLLCRLLSMVQRMKSDKKKARARQCLSAYARASSTTIFHPSSSFSFLFSLTLYSPLHSAHLVIFLPAEMTTGSSVVRTTETTKTLNPSTQQPVLNSNICIEVNLA